VRLFLVATLVSVLCLSCPAQTSAPETSSQKLQDHVVAPPETSSNPLSPADQHLLEEAHALGLNSIEHDLPTPEENARLREEMARSSFMQILLLNGNNFFQNLSPDLLAFKARQTNMQILLANPDSEFYREETNMVYRVKDIALPPTKQKVNEAALRLHDGGPDDAKVEIRYYNTQFRLSMIILDRKSCYLTIRLSPHEPMDSIRLEFAGGKDKEGFASHCVDHFNKLWGVATVQPGGDEKWSFQQKLAALTAVTALLAAIAAFMTAVFKWPEFIKAFPESAAIFRKIVVAPWRKMTRRKSPNSRHRTRADESEESSPPEDDFNRGN